MEDLVAPLNRVGDLQGSVHATTTTRSRTPDGLHRGVPGRTSTAGWGGVPFPSRRTAAAASRGSSASRCRRSSPRPTWPSRCARCSPRAPSTCSLHHGGEEQQETYLPKMVTGEWTGTMNLTEPQAGSDVGRAAHQGGAAGRRHLPHHRHEDLHHLRRARHDREHRPPRAGPHARRAARHQGHLAASSCPKFLRERRRHASASATTSRACRIEHKMGIKASPTCVLSYGEAGEGAVGYLIGEENAGHALHVHDDEQRPPVGRASRASPSPSGPTRMAARLRPGAPAGPGRRRAGGRAVARSSSTPTCAACC